MVANSIFASSQKPPLAPAAPKNEAETVELASFLLDGDAEAAGPTRTRSGSSRGIASSPVALSYRSDASADNPFQRHSPFEDEVEPPEEDTDPAAATPAELASPVAPLDCAETDVHAEGPPEPKRLEVAFENADSGRSRDIDNADLPYHQDSVLTPNEFSTQDDDVVGAEASDVLALNSGGQVPGTRSPDSANVTWTDESAVASEARFGGMDVTPENGTWRVVEGNVSPIAPYGRTDVRARGEEDYMLPKKIIDETPLRKSGFLLKRGFVNTAFKLRWFVVSGSYLVFYKNISDVECRGSICCTGASVDRRRGDALNANTPFAFNLITPQDPYHGCWVLQATSEQERDEWIRVISAISALPLSSDSAVVRASSARQSASPNTALAAGKAAGCIVS